MEIEYLEHLPGELADYAVRLYLSALKDKLVPVLGSDIRAQKALRKGIAKDNCLAAIYRQRLVGILGIQTDKGSFLNPTLKTLVVEYGMLGGFFRMGGLAVLHHPSNPEELYVDGVGVVDNMQDTGIGSRLFDLLERIALKKGIRMISLDVIDTNHRAKALYERLGFIETKRQSLWPLNLIYKFPFKASIQMVKMMG